MNTPSESRKVRVLIADDHPVTREGLAAVLSRRRDFEVVGLASDGQAAVAMAQSLRPDVILMDLRMPVMDGFAAIEAIVRMDPASRILVITTYEGDEDVRRALRAGAKGYLLKDSSREVLWDAVARVYAGGSVISDSMMSQITAAMSKPQLTSRELEILRCLSRGLDNRATAAELHVSEATVKTHVNSILAKLGAANRTQAVVLAVKRGLVHEAM